MKQKVFLDHIGEVELRSSLRVRGISIRIDKEASVLLTFPLFCDAKEAIRFLVKKKDWVIEKKRKILSSKPQNFSLPDDRFRITKEHDLLIIYNQEKGIKLYVREALISVFVNENLRNDVKSIKEVISAGVAHALKLEAKKYLIPEMMRLCEDKKIEIKSVKVGSSRTKWGSCKANNEIILSRYLVMLPLHLREYVMLHELAHVAVKNHSKLFWQHLDSLCNYKNAELRKEMKLYRFNDIGIPQSIKN